MDSCRFCIRVVLCAAAVLMVGLAPSAVEAQIGGVGGGVGGGGFGGGGGGAVGGNFQNAGVVIDAQGVLKVKRIQDRGGLQAKRIVQAAMAKLNPELAKFTMLRKISLTRLEKAVAARIASDQPITDDMKNLAGLMRIHYVFYYPDTGDIVVAGPAEGYAQDLVGRTRGISKGRPILQLEDLITALRAYPPSGSQLQTIGVSIDPTEEGLARLQQFINQNSARVRPNTAAVFAEQMRRQLGMQKVTVQGVSPNTHFAQVMVEADYRMKLIGIGLEDPPVKIKSYIAAAGRGSSSNNALQRWYFVPDYKCIRVAEDELAMQMEGWGVKLVGASELVEQEGTRRESNAQSRASLVFCNSFTQLYPQLAHLEPVYAELRNLIDMSVVAAFIQEKDYYNQADWDLGIFADESAYPVETYEAAKEVESAVNVVWKGNTLLTPIGGGVHVEPRKALESENLLPDENGKVGEAQNQISLKNLPEGQWWWD